MRTRRLALGIVVVVAISMLCVPVAFAQAAGSVSAPGAWAIGCPPLTTVKTDQAIVLESGKVMAMQPIKGVKDGMQMKFKNEQGSVFTVFLGPKWFVENQKIKFMPGDSVMVKGKKLGSSIIATEVSKGDWTMKLRNQEDGKPSWECCFPGSVVEQ